MVRINKLLSNLGICSRKEAARYIEDGRIKINGVLSIPGQWVEEDDEILIDDQPVAAREKVYIALNKPVGITCTAEKTVKDNIIEYVNYPEYIFPVGRLDKPSQGLIILTNDGVLANKILESENEHEKEYIVTLDKDFDEKFIEGMSSGVEICGQITRPCKVFRVDNNTFRIILTQGLNRQIRRMCGELGYNVQKLKRIRIMNIELGNLPVGQYRKVTDSELKELMRNFN